MNQNNKPSKTYKSGSLKVFQWENEREGNKFKSFTFQKSYKEENSEEWKHTQILNLNDITRLKILLDKICMEEYIK